MKSPDRPARIPPAIERHLQPALRDTLEPWQLREVICLCKRVIMDAELKERERAAYRERQC